MYKERLVDRRQYGMVAGSILATEGGFVDLLYRQATTLPYHLRVAE
jgi:hypothetical protein